MGLSPLKVSTNGTITSTKVETTKSQPVTGPIIKKFIYPNNKEQQRVSTFVNEYEIFLSSLCLAKSMHVCFSQKS